MAKTSLVRSGPVPVTHHICAAVGLQPPVIIVLGAQQLHVQLGQALGTTELLSQV